MCHRLLHVIPHLGAAACTKLKMFDLMIDVERLNASSVLTWVAAGSGGPSEDPASELGRSLSLNLNRGEM